MSAYDELQRQLAESVAARARAGRAVGLLGRLWRGRAGDGALLSAIAILLLALVAAVTVPRVVPVSPSPVPLAALLGEQPAEGPCALCRAVGGRLHAPPGPEALADEASPEALPASAAPARLDRHVGVRRGVLVLRWSPSSGPSSRAMSAGLG